MSPGYQTLSIQTLVTDEQKFIHEQNMYDPCLPSAYSCVAMINTT